MGTLTISKEGIVNEMATKLYKDVQEAQSELNKAVKQSMGLDDLDCLRELQIEIEYRMNLFREYIESMR
ncbi:MAG: hypothetical protein ACRCX2_15150 [Paraclostridium sp.]